jgi:hypothetical protein
MRKPRTVVGVITGAMLLMPVIRAGGPPAKSLSVELTGDILGQVLGANGVAQMGATVLLYDRYDKLIRRALTAPEGKFAFDQLPPDSYSIRVTLASFVPAIRRNIAVAAGSEDVLEINLTSLFSTVDLVSSGPSRGTLMSDDWKWVLRSSQSTRPVMRLLPVSSSSQTASSGSIFSNTSGMVTVSAGDGDSFTTGSQQSMGTAFALATSLFGTSRMLFSGNVGYIGSAGLPTAGFRTSYARTTDGTSGPWVTLTVRQLYLSPRGSMPGPLPGTAEAGPALRTISLAMHDKVDLNDNLRMEYGFSMESVSFIDRLNYMSPFVRLSYDLGSKGVVRFGYSNGTQPVELMNDSSAPAEGDATANQGESLNQDLAALAMLPRISLDNDHVNVQRTQNFELGYEKVSGSRTYSVAGYSESVSNAAFNVSGPQNFLPVTDAMPDLGTNSAIFDVGAFNRVGYAAAVKQTLADHLEASIAAGGTGALTTDLAAAGSQIAVNPAVALRGTLREETRPWVTASVAMTIPLSGTHIVSSYGWIDPRTMTPDHYFMTGAINEVTGWNVRVRQPLPFFPSLAGRLEATAELRNMLASGYLPLMNASGEKALLTNAPRAVRGGLAFIF